MNIVQAQAQGPTAVPLSLPTLTPSEVKVDTPTPTIEAATNAPSAARIEAQSKDVGANVRAAPNTDSEILGTIFPGKFYSVTGRYGKWVQIVFDKLASGRGWVFSDIVNITGLTFNQIPEIDPNAVPTANLDAANSQKTEIAITQTPGAPETATALRASVTGVVSTPGSGDSTQEAAPVEPLVTFTFPPPVVEATLGSHTAAINQGGIPPIMPILVLGGLGILGLFVSALRRL
ncbi:MAG: SH3 domain-containing protein [Chloroflexota bacterium]